MLASLLRPATCAMIGAVVTLSGARLPVSLGFTASARGRILISKVKAPPPSSRTFARRAPLRRTIPAPPGRSRSASALTTPLSASVEEEVDPGTVEGTDLRVLRYPHPSLRAPNSDCTEDELKDGSISKIAREMCLVMYAAQGVGLAAPQVGVNKRLMVYNPTGDEKKWLDETILVNPRIVEMGEGKAVENEGCLSFPGMNGDVERSKWIKVEALNVKGKKIKKKFKDWEARIFQHEYDHLDGIVYVDRLTEEGRATVQPRLDELIEEFGDGGAL